MNFSMMFNAIQYVTMTMHCIRLIHETGVNFGLGGIKFWANLGLICSIIQVLFQLIYLEPLSYLTVLPVM